MADIRHRVGVDAPAERVYQALATLFRHGDWREPVVFMYHCSTKWGYLLLGLKAGLEGGAATPYPDDMKISNWG